MSWCHKGLQDTRGVLCDYELAIQLKRWDPFEPAVSGNRIYWRLTRSGGGIARRLGPLLSVTIDMVSG